MTRTRNQAGFTAVELLITLFVAAAFLIASYQLFNLVIKDGGATRAESRASNIAYDYLRQYASSATTIPCTASTPLNNAPLSIDGLTSVTITIAVTCLPDAINSLSKVEATINYNNPSQTIKYALYVSSTGTTSSAPADLTDGLAAWWKFNTNANNAIGTPNGVPTNTTSTSNRIGQANSAFLFNGSSSRVNAASTFGIGAANVTISLWVNNPLTSNNGAFIKIGDATSGYGLGIGTINFDNAGAAGPKLIMLYENVRWIATTGGSSNINTGWHHIVMVVDSAGVPTAYIDGTSAGSYPGVAPIAPAGNTLSIGASTGATARFFNGSIDDVRIYNRALPVSDILKLYSAGAQ